jgi:hypothetical protein
MHFAVASMGRCGIDACRLCILVNFVSLLQTSFGWDNRSLRSLLSVALLRPELAHDGTHDVRAGLGLLYHILGGINDLSMFAK